MLTFEPDSASSFKGRQIFTDGRWVEVSGQLSGDGQTLTMLGGGFRWVMRRR
jgi:hypothetical protein